MHYAPLKIRTLTPHYQSFPALCLPAIVSYTVLFDNPELSRALWTQVQVTSTILFPPLRHGASVLALTVLPAGW